MKGNFIYKKITTLVLILSFVAPVVFTTIPSKAHALEGDYIGGPSNIINAGFSAISAGFDLISSAAQSSLAFKEYVLDPLTVLLRQILIRSITSSIVNWINGGFNGSPAFVTDLNGFLLDVGDKVLGTYLEESGLAFLCSPFSIDVRIALALDYYSSSKTYCSLSGITQNVQDAFGDFSSRNAWDQWYQFSINPNNNALGSFISARQTLNLSIASAQGIESEKLEWGNGFLSWETCDEESIEDAEAQFDRELGPGSGAGGSGSRNAPGFEGADGPESYELKAANIPGGKANCKIETPGSVIYEQLNDTLPSGLKQLELADEINEIIGALLGQLVQQVLGGSNRGLSGLSQSYNGRSSYTDQLLQESDDTSSVSGKTLEAIDASLQGESEYRDAKQTSLDAVRVARGNVEALRQCYLGKASQKRTLWGIVGEGNDKKIVSFTTTELTNSANSASSTIANVLLPLENTLTKDIEKVDTITGLLVAIRTKIENVQSVGDLNTAIREFQTLQQSGQLNDIQEVYDAKLERDGYPGEQHSLAKGIVRDMATLNGQTSTALAVCQSLVLTQQPIISTGN